MRIIDKYNCILCKYDKYNKNGDSCFNHREKDECGYPIGECKSLSNIYYGTLINFFPFKQIDDFRTERAYRKEEKYTKEMDEKYGDCSLEDDDIKFIWGVKSWNDLTGQKANLYTMNKIDITYDKKKKTYMLGIETAYIFENYAAECEYLQNCLNAFTKYMDDNGLNKNKPYILFMGNPCTSMVAESVEELYMNFKIFVDGFCNQSTEDEQTAFMTREEISETVKKLKEYQQLEEEGLLTRTRLAVGTEVYFVSPARGKYFKEKVRVIADDWSLGVTYYFYGDMQAHPEVTGHDRAGFKEDFIGKYIFLSETEAKEALEKMK